jgi:hypothetical protein
MTPLNLLLVLFPMIGRSEAFEFVARVEGYNRAGSAWENLLVVSAFDVGV